MSRNASGSAALASVEAIRTAAAKMIARRGMVPPSLGFSLLAPHFAGRGDPNAVLVLRIPGRFPSRNPSKHAADGHPDAARIPLPEHAARPDLAGRAQVRRRV